MFQSNNMLLEQQIETMHLVSL